MGVKRNYAALDWVIGEISQALNEARQALEAFAEDTRDTARMRFCLTHIHQVLGSLKMVEFHGAALLAEEMEQLAHAMIGNNTVNAQESQEVLMRSLLQLPIYLDHVRRIQDDHPGVVLPLLNDLRASRKAPYLSETNLFTPDLSALTSVPGKAHPLLASGAKLKDVLKKLFEMYQYAAASVLRGIKIDDNLMYLGKVFSRLENIATGTPQAMLWHMSHALIDSLADDDIELSVAVKGLLRRLAREIKQLHDKAPDAFLAPVDEALARNLLYYIARSGNVSERISTIKQQFHLKEALFEGAVAGRDFHKNMISTPEPDTIRSVVAALREEMQTIKQTLSRVATEGAALSELESALPVVKRVSDTLAVLGVIDLRQAMNAEHTRMADLCQSGGLVPATLEVLANNLVSIEHRLDAIAKGADRAGSLLVNERDIEIDEAKRIVLQESRVGLARLKEAIVAFYSSQWNKSSLEGCDALLRDVRGGLTMIPLLRAAAIIEVCAQFIQARFVDADTPPTADVLTSLANAIEGVDYYIERLIGDFADDVEGFLELSEDALRELGCRVPDLSQHLPDLSQTVTDLPQFVADSSQQEAPSAVTGEPYAVPVADEVSPASSPSSVPVQGQAPFESPVPVMAKVSPAESPRSFVLPDGVDEDIADIFVEEAREVLSTLAQAIPAWRSAPDDLETRLTVRRAFHTLKGSGRMVKAEDISELSWAIENLLNRLNEGTIAQAPAHFELVEAVQALLPALVDAFAARIVSPLRLEAKHYERLAHEMSRGLVVDRLQMAVQPPPPVIEPPSVMEESAEQHILWELFASEAQTHLAAIEAFIADMHDRAPLFTTPSDNLQRALHTLKGSAHMAGVSDVAQLAGPLELLMKELRTYHLEITPDVLQLIEDAAFYTRTALASVEQQEPAQLPKLSQFVARVAELRDVLIGPFQHATDTLEPVGQRVDPRLLALFMAEEIELLLHADEVLQRWRADLSNTSELPAMMTELKALELGARQANFPNLAQLSLALHDLYAAALTHLVPDNRLFESFEQAHNCLLDMIDAVAAAQTLPAVPDYLQARLDECLQASPSGQPATVAPDYALSQDPDGIAPLAARDSLFAVDEIDIQSTPGYDESEDMLDLSFVGEGAHTPASSAAPVADASETVLGAELSWADLADLTDLSDSGQGTGFGASSALAETSVSAMEDLAFNAEDMTAADLFDTDSLEAFVEQTENPPVQLDASRAAQTSGLEFGGDFGSPADAEIAPLFSPRLEVTSSEPAPVKSVGFHGGDPSQIDAGDFDQEILDIFLEEANELIEQLEEAIAEWENDWQSGEAPDAMKRALHTLKGGARLAGLSVLGELTHDYETYLINQLGPETTEGFFAAVHQYQDWVHQGVRGVRARLNGEPMPEPAAPVLAMVPDRPMPEVVEPVAAAPSATLLLDAASVPDADQLMPPLQVLTPVPEPAAQLQFGDKILPLTPTDDVTGLAASAKKTANQETVKISSDLLEELVNLAGETSISRGRIEQQVSDLGLAVGEIDITLRRLQEQLRRLDMETEAQIVFRQEQLAEHEEFDSLEMDRYSQLQQLTRSLTESASDLVDLKRTLTDKIKDTEAILVQQQRINSSLQEGLMRARMVPFSRMVPRLRRIVRQVAGELGRQVAFELDNMEGEMDRSVLEHMVAPLEHMLRNAVDHGIESPAERLALGKSESGRILLSFAREGGDILLRLADDGRGIAFDKVRKKAIERGLMVEDAELSDHDIMQFILQAGFSTAENVTQISGRGVGMDVVAAEIKQLGGTMAIESKPSVGTQFTIRLPFTVSVNRALMVNLGDETFAIPLNTIEGIVRVSPFELEHYYSQPESRFEYAGESYEVRYLGAMLYDSMTPRLEGQVMPLPVILVRSAQLTMALQVDSLMGSREIVVKSLGAQFAAVQGLSGATVMGDGSVVVILDPHALVRRAAATVGLVAPSLRQLDVKREIRTILVVDDSVTVRKVTTRFLEREGFNVITAKDGVDALQVLQGRIPDLMLLDIEMPRMDGFEVAKNMRTTEEWRRIPIIMITSRTGDKHREHALSIGVNHYMGKPYQEDVLLQAIHRIIGA